MNYCKRPLGLGLLLLMILMGTQVALKKPLCINSNFVYKIDKIGIGNTESVFNCSQYKVTPFSSYFYENIDTLQSRILDLEVLLAPFNISPKIILLIDEADKDISVDLLNGLQIGGNRLETKDFEKGVIKSALKSSFRIEDEQFLQVISDFMITDGKFQSLISRIWSDSNRDLSLIQKRKLIENLARVLKNDKEFLNLDTLEKLRFISPDQSFANHLKKYGFLKPEEILSHRLDIIVQSDSISDFIDIFRDYSEKFTDKKMAIKDSHGIYLLPSLQKIDNKFDTQLQTQYRIILNGYNNQTEISRYIKSTERLILIRSKLKIIKLNYKPLFMLGVTKFLAANKDIDFIQLHLPSFALKQSELHHISNYFSFIKDKKLTRLEHQVLGWTETKWVKDFSAFKPIANYDVIQYFRIN